MIRATTGGVMKTYRRNLMNSFIGKNNAMNTVLTQRTFNSYAEDPATAAKAFRLRKSRMTVSAQYDVCSDTLKKYQTGFQSLQSIDGLLDTKNGSEQMNTLKETTLRMLNDPEGDARTQLAKALNVLSETIIQDMNQKYGDHFIFAGADGQNVPFEIKDNQLYYRGVPVDAAEPELMADGAGNPVTMPNGSYVLASADLVDISALPALEDDGAGNPITVTAGGVSYYVADNAVSQATPPAPPADPTAYTEVDDGNGNTVYYLTSDLVNQAKYDATMDSVVKDANGIPEQVVVGGNAYYVPQDGTITQADYETAKSDAAKLKYLVDEKKFVDIGLGFQENVNGQLIESSGFNAALNGLTFLGYGLDEDGDPKNIYSLVQQLKEIAESVPEEGQWDEPTYDKFHGLVQKLEAASSDFKTEFTNMDANVKKLENNQQLLKDNKYNLQEQYSNLEDVDMVEAISSFLWAEYAYNAALKVGSSVLSESLMDYLN